MQTNIFYPKLNEYISTLESEFPQIPNIRKKELSELSAYISQKKQNKKDINITVICTHNSRRSHMGQLWLWAAAIYYGVENMHIYSGGTEATAFYPTAVEAMRSAGFIIEKKEGLINPTYVAKIGEGSGRLKLFSKKYDDKVNPQENFAALMVCTNADEACPIVPGADGRFAIPYIDPKEFDGTEKEKPAYMERCRQMAREMFYVVGRFISRQTNTVGR